MWNLDDDALIRVLTVVAVIVSAFIAGLLAFFTQWKLKRLDKNIIEKKDREYQRLKFYLPLLRCLYELDDRLHTITHNLDKDWLDKEHLIKIKRGEGFASDPNKTGYFIISSIYLISSFFGLTEAIKKGIDTTKFSYKRHRLKKLSHKIKNGLYKLLRIKRKINIFQFDPEITKVCRLFQYEELFKNYLTSKSLQTPVDACKIHKHIQHSIGEMMLEKEENENYRVKSFREFYEAYQSDEKFRFWFILIENLFVDLSNFPKDKSIEMKVEIKNDIRPLRLIAIQYWCRILMRNIALELELSEFNLQTRPANDVISTLSDDLKKAITHYKASRTETYLLGVKLEN